MGKGEEPRPKFTLYVHTQADTHTHTHADSRKKRGGAEPKFTSYVHTWKYVEVGLMGGAGGGVGADPWPRRPRRTGHKKEKNITPNLLLMATKSHHEAAKSEEEEE